MKTVKAIILLSGLILLIATEAATRSLQTSNMTGVVRDSARKPVPYVWVVVSQDGSTKGRSLTADDGSYFIKSLPLGAYGLEVVKGKRTLYRGQVRLPDNKAFDITVTGSAQ